MGGIDGVSCQHLQVMMTQLLQKQSEWQEDRRPMMRHGSVIRPTKYLASMHIKTLFDVAGPRHIAKIVEDLDVHGWIIAALLREMVGPEGQAKFESVESTCSFARCIRHGSVEAPRLRLKMAMPILGNDEPEWVEKKMGVLMDTRDGQAHQMCSFMWADNWIMSHSKTHLEHIANFMGDQDVHGWITAALFREMAGLEGQATFENVEDTFPFTRCIRQGALQPLGSGKKMTMQILWNVEPEWKRKKMGLHIYTYQGGERQICSFLVCGQVFHIISLEDDEGLDKWNLEPKPASLKWTSTFADEMMDNITISTRTGQHRILFKKKLKILGYIFNQSGRTQDSLEERMQSASKAWWRDVKIYRSTRCTVENKNAGEW